MDVRHPWQLLLVTLAGWVNRQQQDVITYIQEENRILKNKIKGKRIRFTDEERRRLAVKGKVLGRKALTPRHRTTHPLPHNVRMTFSVWTATVRGLASE